VTGDHNNFIALSVIVTLFNNVQGDDLRKKAETPDDKS
jgi:hypothetical protein